MSERSKPRAPLALALVFLMLVAPGCASYEPTPPPLAGSVAAYRVGAPDKLDVTVLPDPAIHQSVIVRPDGMISFDLVGDIPAGGRTVEEIAADIETRIARFKREPAVTVKLTAAESTAVTVFGEVRGPQAFPLVKETRVAEAIGMVGGETMFARTAKIRVIRAGGGETAVYIVNLNAIRDGDQSTNILLQSGDIVYVPPTVFAKIGYAVNALLLPFQPFFGIFRTFGTALLY
jgi:polysaccharide export outer membrane protein